MATKQQNKPNDEVQEQDRQQQTAKIGDHVLRELGEPGGFYRLQIRWLWDDNYRVNCFVGDDFVSAKVAQSYFVVADNNGAVLSTTPEIIKKYGLVTRASGPSEKGEICQSSAP